VVLQFFLMYRETDPTSPEGEKWVNDPGKIARHYTRSGWFYIDILSIGVSGFDIFAPTRGPLSRFKGFRVIRVLRLIKLMRLVSVARIFKRWEMRVSINYAKLSIVQILVGLLFACHLFACLWGLQASFDPLNTWPGATSYCQLWAPASPDEACPEGKVCNIDDGHVCEGPAAMYVYSLYWALATVTSIGYGDVNATAFNEMEQLVCIGVMFAGAIVFAQIVGSFCGLAASLAPDQAQFRTDLSDLNDHMASDGISADLRYRLREYMHQTLHLRRGNTKQRLLTLLSPALAGEFAYQSNEKWLSKIWFLQDPNDQTEDLSQRRMIGTTEMLVELAMAMESAVFPHGEMAPVGFLYVITKGRALYGGKVLSLGNSWGTDEVLESPGLRHHFPAVSLAYLWTFQMAGETLRSIIAKHPHAWPAIRKHQLKLIRRRGIVRAAEEMCRGTGSEFFGRKQFLYARGDVPIVNALRSLTQKEAEPESQQPPPPSAANTVPAAAKPTLRTAEVAAMPGRLVAPSAAHTERGPRGHTEETTRVELLKLEAKLDAKMDALQTNITSQLSEMQKILQQLLQHQQVSA